MNQFTQQRSHLDVRSKNLVYLTNVPTSLGRQDLKNLLNVQSGKQIKFIETFQAWFDGQLTGNIIIDFYTNEASKTFMNTVNTREIPFLDFAQIKHIDIMGERNFFELIQRNTGIDLLHCDGKPNTGWSPNRRQNRQTAAAIGKLYDDRPPQTVNPAARVDDSHYNSTTIAAGPNQTSPHNVGPTAEYDPFYLGFYGQQQSTHPSSSLNDYNTSRRILFPTAGPAKDGQIFRNQNRRPITTINRRAAKAMLPTFTIAENLQKAAYHSRLAADCLQINGEIGQATMIKKFAEALDEIKQFFDPPYLQKINAKMLMSSIRRAMQSSRKVEHDIKNLKFFIPLENKNEAILEYKKLPERVIEMYHTEVPSEFRGKGLAENLVKDAFRHCIDNNYKVYPSCTYVEKYVRDLATEEEKKIVVKQPKQPYINADLDN